MNTKRDLKEERINKVYSIRLINRGEEFDSETGIPHFAGVLEEKVVKAVNSYNKDAAFIIQIWEDSVSFNPYGDVIKTSSELLNIIRSNDTQAIELLKIEASKEKEGNL